MLLVGAASIALSACAGMDAATKPGSAQLNCDDSLKSAFKPDANTTITFVKSFKKGDPLALPGTPASPPPPVASNDACLVKLNVGPGNPGPVGAPSTAAGIGIEVWLPSAANWNGRIRSTGDGAFSGNPNIAPIDLLRPDVAAWATERAYVSSISDGGHVNQVGVSYGAFAVNPDGTINTTLWKDLSTRSIQQLAEKTKLLAAAYYGSPANYAYYAGCSGGGRIGYASAQTSPKDFNGILAEAPSINQTQFYLHLSYPGFVVQRELGGVPFTREQLEMVSQAAVDACDTALNGKHDGYLSDPAQCTYDPMTDRAVLCMGDGGTNVTPSCLSKRQAAAVNKIWYGPTTDGTVPSPSVDNGFHVVRSANHLWWGVPRGTALGPIARQIPDDIALFGNAIDQVALSLQDPTLSTVTPLFKNAAGNGADGWKALSYADYANALLRGKMLNDPWFGDIDTNNPDMTAFRLAGGKLITIQGLADTIVPPMGAVEYYERSTAVFGGYDKIQQFHRLYLVPGRGHCGARQGAPTTAKPPILNQANTFAPWADNNLYKTELFEALVQWVEKGTPPTTFTAVSADKKVSRPICLYPKKLAYMGGDTDLPSSYTCK
jgi:feruloyl esterase